MELPAKSLTLGMEHFDKANLGMALTSGQALENATTTSSPVHHPPCTIVRLPLGYRLFSTDNILLDDLSRIMDRDGLPSLLLLPFPPEPVTRPALSTAYKPALAAAIAKLKDASTAQMLMVAVASPLLRGSGPRNQALSWSQAQHLVAGLYSMIAIVCAELGVPTYMNAGPGSVDARVILLDHNRSRQYPTNFRPAIEPNNTAIVDMATFVAAYFPWNYIFNTDSEVSHELRSLYLRLAEGHQVLLQDQLITVKGGISLNVPSSEPPILSTQDTALHKTVCLGGTFDHLHPGHKLLLTAGAYLLDVPKRGSSETCTYIIGITGDSLLRNKKDAHVLQSWDDRARNVLYFLSSILELSTGGWRQVVQPDISDKNDELVATFRSGTITVQCVKIQDPFGPTITEQSLDSLVVSAETRSGGQAVNDKRTEKGWRPLEVFEVDVLDAGEATDVPTETQDFSTKISSTAIRRQIAQATAHHRDEL